MMEDYIQFSAKTKNDAITKACIELEASSDQLDIQVISEGSSGFFGIGSKPAIIKVRKKEVVSEEEEIKDIIGNVGSVKLDSIQKETKKESPKQEKAANKPAPKAPAKAEPVKEKQSKEKMAEKTDDKPAKEKPAKEKQPKEKPVKEKPAKEKPAKAPKPVEIITDEAEIKEIEERAVVFLRDVFASMNLGEVEIKSVYNRTDGCLDVDFEGEDMGILIGKRGQTLDSLQYLTERNSVKPCKRNCVQGKENQETSCLRADESI